MFVITLEDETYDFDDDHLMISEAILLKKVARLTPERWGEGLRTRTCMSSDCDGWTHQPDCDLEAKPHQPCVGCNVEEHKLDQDPECVKALVWLAVRRAKGDACPRYSEFDFDFAGIDIDQVDPDADDESDEASGLDPTAPAIQTAT